jgi:phosphoribosylglycinamide formyltransferase-1
MKKQTIGLITYQCPHLKTEQVLRQLLMTSQFTFRMYALPFVVRKSRNPVFEHRPNQSKATSPETLAQENNIPLHICASDKEIDNQCEIYLILGAGILSPDCVRGKKIINGHPGIIPSSRGLDSFKWAIHQGDPLGVTLHYIDGQVDAGEIISIIPTPVYLTDTLTDLAERHYKNEIDSLSRFHDYLLAPQNSFKDIKPNEAHMRMPHEIEREMIEQFPHYLKKYGTEKQRI